MASGIIGKAIRELKNRKVFEPQEIAFRSAVSVAGHILNLRQRGFKINDEGKEVHDESLKPIYGYGEGADLRNHLFILGGPGTGKNFIGTQAFDPDVGIFSGAIPVHRMGKATDAGLVGGKVAQPDGTFEWEHGSLVTHSDEIVFCPEFSSLMKSSKMSHSGTLIETLLEALDSGQISVTQAGVDYQDKTRATFMCGTQPGRIEQVSGFDRRFIFYRISLHTKERRRRFKRSIHEYMMWEPDFQEIGELRDEIQERFRLVDNIKKVRLDASLIDWLVDSDDMPYVMQGTITKALIATWFLDAPEIESDFVIPNDEYLKNYAKELVEYRDQVTSSSEVHKTLLANTAHMSNLVKRLKDDRICTSQPKAREEIERVVRAYASGGLRYLVFSVGKGAPQRVPTALSPKEVLPDLPTGAKFLHEEDADGNVIERDELD